MKYTPEEEFQEILRRSGALRKKKDRRISGLLAGSSAALFALLVLCISALTGNGSPEGFRSVYGAFLLPAEAGGYVLVAVAAFAAGAAVTAWLLWKRNRKKDEN